MALTDKRLLLVCDDKNFSSMLRDVLESSVKMLTVVGGHNAACTRLQQGPFDAVLLHEHKTPLTEAKNAFQFCQMKGGAHAQSQFFILGAQTPGLEAARKIAPQLRVIDDATDAASLLKSLSELYSENSVGAPAAAPASAVATPSPASARTAAAVPPPAQPQVDATTLGPLLAAALEMIKAGAQREPERGNVFVASPSAVAQAPFAVSTSLILDFESGSALGAFALHLDINLALHLVHQITRSNSLSLTEAGRQALLKAWQGIPERAQGELKKQGKTFQGLKAQVLAGNSSNLPQTLEAARLCIPFRTASGACLVDCGMRPKA